MLKPKYMENLHVAICAITGTPRIVKVKSGNLKTYFITDKYADIPKEEWDSVLMQYFRSFENNTRQFAVGENDWSFFAGGHFESADKLIQCLENCIAEVKVLRRQDDK